MNERLLHFIWQFQYFNKNELATTDGEPIQVIAPGTYNTEQGPDFLNARIKIGKELLAGNIELHLKASDWFAHKHERDKRYNNIILHIVYEHDLQEKFPFPTLELGSRISSVLLERYAELMRRQPFIPCQNHISSVPQIAVMACKDSMLAQRLEERLQWIVNLQHQNENHWEETFWWMLARNFGVFSNREPFFEIARSIPLNVLFKCSAQIHQSEALLLGQAGLLSADYDDDYAIMLFKEYKYLSHKYGLQPPFIQLNFLRMRPANFPTLRLAQLAMLIHKSRKLFSVLLEETELQKVKALFVVAANDYWNNHYTFSEVSPYKVKYLGEAMINNIVINTVIPVVYAYGAINKNGTLISKANKWMEQIPDECNIIISNFQKLGIDVHHAGDSQALLYLKKNYCDKRKCLSCAIGNNILKKAN